LERAAHQRGAAVVEAFSAYTSYGDKLGALEKLKPRVSENAIKTHHTFPDGL
jgi:hypothetical protein